MSPRVALQCSYCDATFARQEHLTRHLRTHTREKPYPCPQCSKSFSRQDVLNRHLIAHRHASRTSAIISARACLECASNRVRCSKETPCQRCRDRRLTCTYPAVQTDQSAISHPQVDSPVLVAADFIHVGDPAPDVPPSPASQLQQSTSRSLRASDGRFEASSWHHDPDASYTYATTQQDIRFDPSGDDGIGLSTINWLSPDFQHSIIWEDFAMPFPTEGPAYSTPTWGNVPEDSAMLQTVGWPQPPATISAYSPTRTGQPSHPSAQRPQNGAGHPSTSSPSQTSSKTSGSTDGPLYVDGSGGRAPFGGRLLRKHAGDGEASMETSSPTGSQEPTFPHSPVSVSAYSHMQQAIAQHQPDWLMNDEHARHLDFPSTQDYVRSYFSKFHTALPFVRPSPASFDNENGWILLVAVAATGAGYLDRAAYDSLSSLLDKLSDTLIFANPPVHQGAAESTELLTGRASQLQLLQAGILNMIMLVHKDNKQYISRGLLHRFHLIEQCKSLSLLSSKKRTTESNDTVTNWLASQAEIRTGMVLWLLDSLMSAEFGCAELFCLYDATCSLPSLDDFWILPTLERITKNELESVTIADALELLYMENRLPSNLSEFSKVLLIHGVCRRMKEAIYHHKQTLASWTPEARAQPRNRNCRKTTLWPPSDPILVKWRNSSCDCLDVLHWNANMISAGAGGWEHPTILHLHMSRLLILTPVESIRYVAEACPSVVDGSRRDPSFEEAYTNIRKWALVDQYKARLAIIHAGAILWHVRRYSIKSFMEPFATYVAILVVWSYSTSVIAYQRHSQMTHPLRSGPDYTEACSPAATSTDDEDLTPTFIHLDRPCDDEIVQAYVRKGQKMEANMVRIGKVCSAGAPQKILREGLRVLSGERSWTTREISAFNDLIELNRAGMWGAKWTFVKRLADLARATGSS